MLLFILSSAHILHFASSFINEVTADDIKRWSKELLEIEEKISLVESLCDELEQHLKVERASISQAEVHYSNSHLAS